MWDIFLLWKHAKKQTKEFFSPSKLESGAHPDVQTLEMKNHFWTTTEMLKSTSTHAVADERTRTHARTRRRSHTLSLSVCVMFLALPLFVFAGRAKAEPARQTTTKRRKRKNSASSANSSVGTAAGKKRSPATNFSLSSQVPVSISSTRFASSYYVTLSFFFFFLVLFFVSACMPAGMNKGRKYY